MNTISKISLVTLCICSLGFGEANAKAKEGVIMTVDGEDVPSYEFLYLFNKNNLQQQEPQTLDEYLELFETYRLKVAEAKKQGVDTASAFIKEMNQYRRELLEPYITDSLYFKRLVDEAAFRDSILVESSHIMIIRTNDEETDASNLAMLDSLRTEILNGADFIEIAKIYSQDKFSSDKGGYLGFNPAGTFPYGFETAVYETPEGEISDIVESHVGWHIVKSGARKNSREYNRPPRSYEAVKADVERRTSSPFDIRYHELRQKSLEILKRNHPEINVDSLPQDEAFTTLIEAEEITQYNSNPDYRNLVDEYINGSLLYAVSVDNIWNKASNDTEGQKNYFEAHKNEYKWESPHAKGLLVQAKNDSVANEIKIQIAQLPSDSVVTYIKKNFKNDATVDRFNVSQGVNGMIDNLMFGGEPTSPKSKNFETYFILQGRIVESPETYEDVRSVVINDYQEQLEKDWVEALKQTHTVKLNKKELNKIRKALKQ